MDLDDETTGRQPRLDVARALEKIAIVGMDAGHRFPAAWWIKTFGSDGRTIQRRILQSPKHLQELIKIHSRNVTRLRDKFVIDLAWLKKRNDLAQQLLPNYQFSFAHKTISTLYRTSYAVRNEAYLLRKRQTEAYDRIAAQVLEASGARAGRYVHTEGTASQHTLPKLKVIFAFGADCGPAAGIKTHSADFRNGIIRAVEEQIGWQHLDAMGWLAKEGFTSQVCPDPSCLHSPGDHWTGDDVGKEVQSDWIRSSYV